MHGSLVNVSRLLIIFMLVYRLLLSFLFINKCLPVNKLAQITPKLTHPVVLQLSICLSGSQVRLDI